MKVKIKDCSGIATQVKGQEVEVNKGNDGLYHFVFNNECWVCSEWAIEEEK